MSGFSKSFFAGLAMAAMLGGASHAAADNRHVIAAVGIDITTVDPHKITGGGEYMFFSNVFESLYGHDLDGKLEPHLAVSHELSEDGLTYTFKLRPDVKFHNGDPFTSEDVRFSWQRSNDPDIRNPRAGIVTRNIKDVEVVDPLTVRFHLGKPDAALLENLGEYFYMVPKAYTESIGNDEFGRRSVGTGPYKFVSRRINEVIELEAHKDYWGTPPDIDRLSLRVVPDSQTRVAMLQTGEADIALNLPPQLAKSIDAAPETKMVVSPSFQNIFIVINMRRPDGAFASPKVRQALNYAVDKDALIKRVMFGFATQSTGPCHRDIIGCDIDREPYPFDPKKAKQLLEEENFDFSKTYRMFGLAPGRAAQSKEVLEAVAFYLNQVGIKTEMEFLEYGAWLAKLQAKEFDTYSLFWQNWTDYNNDPMGRLPRNIRTDGYYSWVSYPDLDPMIDEANAISDPQERVEHLRKIFTRLYDDPPWIILWTTDNTDAARANIDWRPRANISWPVFADLRKN
ncbi:MAG: ABC transporter substrate-binding protein [Alphaproteobacteria bacterium]